VPTNVHHWTAREDLIYMNATVRYLCSGLLLGSNTAISNCYAQLRTSSTANEASTATPQHLNVLKTTDINTLLFNLILYSKHHVLHSILSDRSDFNYNLRSRRHNLVLTAKSSSITDRDYITRMIFKNIYWCWYIHLLFFSLPVYMFRFRLLLLFIIVHLMLKFF